MNQKCALTLLFCAASALATGCGAGGGASIPKSLLRAHGSDGAGSVAISTSESEPLEAVVVSSRDSDLVVDATEFYSSARIRGAATLDLAHRTVLSRRVAHLSPNAPSIVINDRAVLSDLSRLGSEIAIERREGFAPDAGDVAHVTVLVELSRPTDRMPERSLMPRAHVTVSHDESTGMDLVVLSFTGVDPTAERMVNDMLHDISRVLIIRTDR